MTKGVLPDTWAGDGPDEEELRQAVQAGLRSEREQPLVDAAQVERALRREIGALAEHAQRHKARLRGGQGGGGRR